MFGKTFKKVSFQSKLITLLTTSKWIGMILFDHTFELLPRHSETSTTSTVEMQRCFWVVPAKQIISWQFPGRVKKLHRRKGSREVWSLFEKITNPKKLQKAPSFREQFNFAKSMLLRSLVSFRGLRSWKTVVLHKVLHKFESRFWARPSLGYLSTA